MIYRLVKPNTKILLNTYTNGNSTVSIYSDGTKVRSTEDDEFKPEFPENIDVKITNRCRWNCPFCHEASTPLGDHGDINHPIFDSLVPGTEMAIGGGNIFEHPDIDVFLSKLKERGIIANITINQHDMKIAQRATKVNQWMKANLVYGVGVSWDGTDISDIIKDIYNPENLVIHTIAGVHDLNKLTNKNKLKVLILGYKDLRRGVIYKQNNNVTEKIKQLENNLSNLLKQFKVLSFDNLALKQLNVKNYVTAEVWDSYYMGDDGTHTMFIDLPNNQFASSSTSTIRYDLTSEIDIRDIFNTVINEK